MKLWQDENLDSSLEPYIIRDGKIRPAILVIPGGGYECVCESTEGSPIARRFNELGFHAFVLNYRVAPHRAPEPEIDAMRAMRTIRFNSDRWNVCPDHIAVCGFSAGAHLAASLGTITERIPNNLGDEIDHCDYRPNAMLLCYGTLSFEPWSHQGSVRNLLGEKADTDWEQYSLEKQVHGNTPPAFVWHTAEDQMVPHRNSMAFAEAMWSNGRQCELHVYPHGPHGMQMGYGRQDISTWPEQAAIFLRGSCGFRFPDAEKKRTVVLTFDDAVKSHLTNVAPVLQEFGFGATFFICRFNDDWRAKNTAHLLAIEEIRQLQEMGFEIGNHTVNHPDLRKCSESQCEEELVSLNEFLQSGGIPSPTSFAYPGGPFAENAVPALKRCGIALARTTEPRAWNSNTDSPYQIPSFPLQKDDELAFYHAIANCREDNAVVLVFHGVPDLVHQFVSTSLPFFRKCLRYLSENDYRVIGMKEYASMTMNTL